MTDQKRYDRRDHVEENTTLKYVKGSTYEITINPNDDHQCFKADSNRTQHVYDLMRPYIRKYLKCEWKLYTEVSEPSHMNAFGGVPRVHFHGVITLKNVTAFKETIHYLAWISDIEINVYDKDYWDEYMTKSVAQISADIGSRYSVMTSEDIEGIGIQVEPPYNFFKGKVEKPVAIVPIRKPRRAKP